MNKNGQISGTFWDKVLKIAQLSAIVGLIFTIGVTWGQSQDRMFDSPEQKAKTVLHTNDKELSYKDVHMTLSEKQAEFPTRREYDLLVKGQDEIKKLIRDINQK